MRPEWRRPRRAAGLLAVVLALAAPARGDTEMAIALSSPAFRGGEEIPVRFTCEGADASPPLSWSGAPAGTRSFALIVSDPDAPDPAAPQRTWVHWVLYDLPASSSALAEDVEQGALPAGTRSGRNDWRREGYGGPCPPIGRHRYFFRLYALDSELGDLGSPDAAKLLAAMKGHVLGEAELVGTYQKRAR